MLDAFARRLYKAQAKYLRGLAADFSIADSVGTKDFVLALQYIVAHTDLRPTQISDQMQVSEATLTRWMNGVVTPHELIRRVGFEQLQELLNERAARFESLAAADLTTVQGRLKYARELLEDTDGDCASTMGVTSGTWRIWEAKGFEVIPESARSRVIAGCAKHLACSVEWLRDGTGDPPRFNPVGNQARWQEERERWEKLPIVTGIFTGIEQHPED